MGWQFLLLDGQWYCALTPTYHYTRDGYRDSLFLSEYLTGIKQLDRNPAVYGQTRMWASYLHGEEEVLDPQETILNYGELTFTADRAIDDAAWLADPRKDGADGTAEVDKSSLDELALFEVEL